MYRFNTPAPAGGGVPAVGRTDAIAALRVPPRRVPQIGQILPLASGDVRYRAAPLRLRVAGIRSDISDWYGGEWVWVEGHELDDTGHPICWQQSLIRVAVLDPPPRQDPATPVTIAMNRQVGR